MFKTFGRLQYNSPVILTFALISLGALLLARVTHGVSTYLLFSVYKSSLTDPLFYLRLFCHIFGHVDTTHYLNNFLIILLVGPMLEEKYGSARMVIMIAVTALLTGLLYVLVFENKALLGASGVVFMLILLSSFVNLEKGRIPITLILVVILYIGREVLEGLSSTDNISHIAHIVGGLSGACFGYFMNKEKWKEKKKEELI